MYRKLISACLIFLFVFSAIGVAYCEEPISKEKNTAIRKLGRGVANILTFPLEVPHQISDVSNIEGPTAGLTYGLFKGIVMMVVRLGSGLYETVTFMAPVPPDYKPLLTDPEFFLEDKSW